MFIYSFNFPIEGNYLDEILRLRESKYFIRVQTASKMVEPEFGPKHFDIDLKHFVSLLAKTKAECVSHSKHFSVHAF